VSSSRVRGRAPVENGFSVIIVSADRLLLTAVDGKFFTCYMKSGDSTLSLKSGVPIALDRTPVNTSIGTSNFLCILALANV